MKVHYKSITDDLIEVIAAAKLEYRTIDKIELSKAEMRELATTLPGLYCRPAPGECDRFDGVRIEVSK